MEDLSNRFAIVHGLSVVSDETGRLLLFQTESQADVFADAVRAESADLILVVSRTPEQIEHLVMMNAGDDANPPDWVVEIDPDLAPEEATRRAAEIAQLMSGGAGPACAGSYEDIVGRLMAGAPAEDADDPPPGS